MPVPPRPPHPIVGAVAAAVPGAGPAAGAMPAGVPVAAPLPELVTLVGFINGDVVSAEDLQREKMKIDISALLGGDVYSMLRQRSERAQTRFSKERDANKALNERQKCLVKLAQSGDIPAEVLMSLPSPEEIMRRAEEAKAKAQAALAAQPQV